MMLLMHNCLIGGHKKMLVPWLQVREVHNFLLLLCSVIRAKLCEHWPQEAPSQPHDVMTWYAWGMIKSWYASE